MIRALLIDIDNTLLDFDAYVKQTMREGFEKFGLGEYEDSMFGVFLRINTELWQMLERGELAFEELKRVRWTRILTALGIDFDGCVFEEFFRARLFDSAIPTAGAMELLSHLDGRYILCVASNGPRAQQVNRLRLAGMLPYFSQIFVSESVGVSKPAPEFFAHCINELNRELSAKGERELLPSEVLMIGDSLTSDIGGATAFGIKTCFFDRTASTKGSELPIDITVTSLFELIRIL